MEGLDTRLVALLRMFALLGGRGKPRRISLGRLSALLAVSRLSGRGNNAKPTATGDSRPMRRWMGRRSAGSLRRNCCSSPWWSALFLTRGHDTHPLYNMAISHPVIYRVIAVDSHGAWRQVEKATSVAPRSDRERTAASQMQNRSIDAGSCHPRDRTVVHA